VLRVAQYVALLVRTPAVGLAWSYRRKAGLYEIPAGMVVLVEEARRVRRLGEVFVLERSAQGGGVSDLSCFRVKLVKFNRHKIWFSVLR